MSEEDNMPNEENYEEVENVDGMNQGMEEYEEENMNENGEEEEGQDVYAFDIQINEDSYLLIIGKTDENKLLLRLIDKEDETKPFFQNEFSLEDLRNINPFFNNVDDENIAFQYIIGNLNDAEKEIKILDQEKIKLSISINEEEGKVDINFVLFKTMNEFEGEEENQQENMENEGEEGQEGDDQIEIDINKLRHSEEDSEPKTREGLSSNLPLQIGGKSIEKKEISKKNNNGVETIVEKKEITIASNKNDGKPETKKEITIVKETKVEPSSQEKVLSNKESLRKSEKINQNNNEEINLVKKELLDKINALNENFNNQLFKQNESFLEMKRDMKEENENKIKELRNELNKKDKDLNEMKNKFENINKKMVEIEKNLNENKNIMKNYEQKINELNNKLDNVNEKVKNINSTISGEIEKNNKKIKMDIDQISKQMNEKSKLRKSMEKEETLAKEPINNTKYDEIINDLSGNIENIQNQINEIKSIIDNNQNNNEDNLNSINEKLINLEEKIKENDNALLNIENGNKKGLDDNEKKNIYNKLNDLENNIDNFNSKFKGIEDNLRNSFNKKVSKNENNEMIFNDKLSNLENAINNIESKLINLENNKNNENNEQKPENNEAIEIFNERINELENYAKNIENKINDYEIDQIIQNLSMLMEKQNDNEIYDKLNNLEIEINEIKKNSNKPNIELRKSSEKKNNIEIDKKINNIENIVKSLEAEIRNINDENMNNNRTNLNKRTDTLEKRIANVSKQSDDLDIKTDQLFNITKKLENVTKELDKKTNDIMEKMNNMTKEPYKSDEKLRNIKKNATERSKYNYYTDNNTGKQYSSSENLNNNVIQNNMGYQIYKIKDVKQKQNYEIDNQYNSFQNETNNTGNKNYGESNYSYSVKPESNHIDSKIVNDNEIRFLVKRIRDIHPKINNIYFNLVYRASEDGDKAADFHKKCDKIGPNITLIKTKRGYVFGGFTFKNWEHMPRDIDVNKPNLGSASRDSRAFGFSVSNQKIYNNEKPNEFAIWCNRNFGPTFKNNLFQIFDSCLRKGGYCSVRSNSHFGGQYYDYEISGGESRFRIEELEVYELKLM